MSSVSLSCIKKYNIFSRLKKNDNTIINDLRSILIRYPELLYEKCKDGEAIIHLLAGHPIGHPLFLKYISKYPELLKIVNSKNESVMHYASRKGNHGNVKYILESNVNPNITNVYGETPLHLAMNFIDSGHLATVYLLLKYGAKPYVLNMQGHTPFRNCPLKDMYVPNRKLVIIQAMIIALQKRTCLHPVLIHIIKKYL
jgi:hypothetical protein